MASFCKKVRYIVGSLKKCVNLLETNTIINLTKSLNIV